MRSGRPVEVIDWADVVYLADRCANCAIEIVARETRAPASVEIARLAEAFLPARAEMLIAR